MPWVYGVHSQGLSWTVAGCLWVIRRGAGGLSQREGWCVRLGARRDRISQRLLGGMHFGVLREVKASNNGGTCGSPGGDSHSAFRGMTKADPKALRSVAATVLGTD